MKGKRVIALVLAGGLTFGQTVWAEEVSDVEENRTEIVQEEQNGQSAEDRDIQNNNITRENESEQRMDVQSEASDDRVVFNDSKLENKLINLGIDKNKDGYISKSEMKDVTRLSLSYAGITDLTGLEYAENLKEITLNGNKSLGNINALLGLKKLEEVVLTETGVPTSEKWKIAKCESKLDMTLGDQRNVIINGNIFDEGEVNIKVLEGNNVAQMKGNSILAIATGEATIDLSGDGEHKIEIKVSGIEADQNIRQNSDATIKGKNKSTILGTNGELWQLYPEKKKIDSNVKRYVGGWIYAGGDSDEYAYHLKNDNSLWNNNKKIADDVEQFSGRYILNSKGELIDIYDTSAAVISDIKAWNELQRISDDLDENGDYITHGYSTLYVLKNDGTLWKREEVKKGNTSNDFEKVAEKVKEFNVRGYLREEGGYISFDEEDIEDAAELPEEIEGIEFYVSKDGHTYINTASYGGKKNWVDVGNTEVVDVGRGYYMEDGTEYPMTYYLTKGGEFYKIKYRETKSELVANEVKEIKSFDTKVYIGTDGLARTFEDKKIGTPEAPVVVNYGSLYDEVNDGEWQLVDYGVAGDYNFLKNGVLILTHVKEIFYIDGSADYDMFAVRTDGTVWNINGVPEQVLDLNTKVIKGDIDGNNEVDIQDLRTILRAVCEKEVLTETQTLSADINEDGKVDIQDLRKVLRFVCGKEAEL